MEISIGLSFPGTLKDESVICYLCKNFAVEIIIIEASFSMSAGWAILKLIGPDAEVSRLLEYLAGRQIKIQKIVVK
jgi:hypothetical protein